MKTLGLYLHIPFCIKKCMYCDFLSFENTDTLLQSTYVSSLIREIENKGLLYGREYTVDTIFIGGGTPSLINEALTVDIMSAVKANFNMSENAEITIESNPKTLTPEKLKAYLEAGINRLSMGVQSMDDKCLKQLGRIHTVQDFAENFQMARDAGFDNINIDLMFAIPGQNLAIWQETLDQAISLAPEHISFYSLQIEEETPFFELFKEGKLDQPVDSVDRDMYHLAVRTLQNAGYLHYEISNAAKPGRACRHNLKYWSFGDYAGLGLGAHSFIGGARSSNTRDINVYIEKLSQGENPEIWHHENSLRDNVSEYVFTGLRKMEGLDLLEFHQRFGKPIQEFYKEEWPDISEFIRDKYLIMDNSKLKLTEKGIDISNTILAEFV